MSQGATPRGVPDADKRQSAAGRPTLYKREYAAQAEKFARLGAIDR